MPTSSEGGHSSSQEACEDEYASQEERPWTIVQMTCCRLKHNGMNKCDPESLVLPLLGLWPLLTIKVNSVDGKGAKALYTLMCNQRDTIFPKRFQFVKGRTTTNVI